MGSSGQLPTFWFMKLHAMHVLVQSGLFEWVLLSLCKLNFAKKSLKHIGIICHLWRMRWYPAAILPHGTTGTRFPTLSITWYRKEPVHQQPWYRYYATYSGVSARKVFAYDVINDISDFSGNNIVMMIHSMETLSVSLALRKNTTGPRSSNQWYWFKGNNNLHVPG